MKLLFTASPEAERSNHEGKIIQVVVVAMGIAVTSTKAYSSTALICIFCHAGRHMHAGVWHAEIAVHGDRSTTCTYTAAECGCFVSFAIRFTYESVRRLKPTVAPAGVHIKRNRLYVRVPLSLSVQVPHSLYHGVFPRSRNVSFLNLEDNIATHAKVARMFPL